jgi:hypothetical protein
LYRIRVRNARKTSFGNSCLWQNADARPAPPAEKPGRLDPDAGGHLTGYLKKSIHGEEMLLRVPCVGVLDR